MYYNYTCLYLLYALYFHLITCACISNDYVCNEVSKGVASVSLETGVPVMFGVVTTENIEQAIERAGTKAGNKGYDCAMGALEMIDLMKQL